MSERNEKLRAIEIQSAVQLESEKVAVEEIVDVNGAGGLLVVNPGFRYTL